MTERQRGKLLKAKRIEAFLEPELQYGRDLDDTIKIIKECFEAEKIMNKEMLVPADGDDILICGKIGNAGTSIVKKLFLEKLLERLPQRFIDRADICDSLYSCYPQDSLLKDERIKGVFLVGEGGLYRALFNLWKLYEVGFWVDYGSVPIDQTTVEFCEIFDMDPWGLMSYGSILIIARHGGDIRNQLREAGFCCEVVGKMIKGKDKLIVHKENISRLNRPKMDEILGVMKGYI